MERFIIPLVVVVLVVAGAIALTGFVIISERQHMTFQQIYGRYPHPEQKPHRNLGVMAMVGASKLVQLVKDRGAAPQRPCQRPFF